MEQLTLFEKQVMEHILSGNLRVLDILRSQLINAKVKSRSTTSAGMFIEFSISTELKSQVNDAVIGDLYAYLNKEKPPVGFLLFIKEGKISSLEGFTFTTWPEKIDTYDFVYGYGERVTFQDSRDLSEIEKLLWKQWCFNVTNLPIIFKDGNDLIFVDKLETLDIDIELIDIEKNSYDKIFDSKGNLLTAEIVENKIVLTVTGKQDSEKLIRVLEEYLIHLGNAYGVDIKFEESELPQLAVLASRLQKEARGKRGLLSVLFDRFFKR